MLKFPHISLFRHVLAYVKHVNTDPEVPALYRVDKPVMFRGSIKLHGANCGVVWTAADNSLQAQSRDTLLHLPSDDYKGFAQFIADNEEQVRNLIDRVVQYRMGQVAKVALYGEWVGKGMHKGVAVSKFEQKHWALFGAAVVLDDSPEVIDMTPLVSGFPPGGRIGNTRQAGEWSITIDFNDPESIATGQDQAARITEAIAEQCPYGTIYNLEGPGEGIVWLPMGEFAGREDLMWKHKTKAHSVVFEPKIRKERPVVADDVKAAIDAFVEQTVTTNRLAQGCDALEQQGKGVERCHTGTFIQWVSDDVKRECKLELVDAGLNWKQVANAVVTKARVFFLAT